MTTDEWLKEAAEKYKEILDVSWDLSIDLANTLLYDVLGVDYYEDEDPASAVLEDLQNWGD
jgi:hypothetical protein